MIKARLFGVRGKPDQDRGGENILAVAGMDGRNRLAEAKAAETRINPMASSSSILVGKSPLAGGEGLSSHTSGSGANCFPFRTCLKSGRLLVYSDYSGMLERLDALLSRPSCCKTSSVCSPKRGARLCTAPGDPVSFTGMPGTVTGPSLSGCGPSCPQPVMRPYMAARIGGQTGIRPEAQLASGRRH